MKLKNSLIKYICPECNHTFIGKDTLLVLVKEDCKNFSMMSPFLQFVFANSDKIITGGQEPPQKGDYELACPKCKEIQHFGFDASMEE